MSEELRQKGYLDNNGIVQGDPVGPYEGFNLGATTLDQLRRAGLIPDKDYRGKKGKKPDGLVVDRRAQTPIVKLVVEYKDRGEFLPKDAMRRVAGKVAADYCRPLECEIAAIGDLRDNGWFLVDEHRCLPIIREDGYPLDQRVDLASDAGRSLLDRVLARVETGLDRGSAKLIPLESVNPTRLAEQTWQDIWLACGADPEASLATFVELLIFKFLSDLGILRSDASGHPVDFVSVSGHDTDKILRAYYDDVRPAIRSLFPSGSDGTSVIDGIVLDPKVQDQGILFRQVLMRFGDFGSLRRIDPEFKSRIFERFLKKSLSVKNWGQYFTPRNVVKAMVEMSGVEFLPPQAVVADPACGVGGFILEPLMNKRPHDFRDEGAPNLRYVGWDRDDKTIILAKANMLIHLSEVIERDPAGSVARLASVLNETFSSVSDSATGSLARAPQEEFDLVMTNPPYVTRGSGRHRDLLRQQTALATYYSIPGIGIENLFIQLVINGLRPGARALVIVPDGLLLRHTERHLRDHILRACYLEAIISLPKNTFYSTPKKTYILVIRKKQRCGDAQTDPVFSYLVTNVGETRDARRFVIQENDLPEMAASFRLFQGNPAAFTTSDPRCRTFPIERFNPDDHWLVDKWWTREDREKLGDLDEEAFVGATDLAEMLGDVIGTLQAHQQALSGLGAPGAAQATVAVSLADQRLFRMSLGKRVLKKDLFYATPGAVPLYSANVEEGEEHGWVSESNLDDFSHPSLLWSIDSDFDMSIRDARVVFATTDHCGRLEILDPDLDPGFCRAAIVYGFGREYGFDRVTRPSLRRMKKVTFNVPVRPDGGFDLQAQKALATEFAVIRDTIEEAKRGIAVLADLKPRVGLPAET